MHALMQQLLRSTIFYQESLGAFHIGVTHVILESIDRTMLRWLPPLLPATISHQLYANTG